MDLKNEKIEMEKNGKKVFCDILFTFDSEETLKCYVGYTDHSIGKNGRKNIYVSCYNPLVLNGKLEDITDEDELRMVNEVLIRLDEQANGQEDMT